MGCGKGSSSLVREGRTNTEALPQASSWKPCTGCVAEEGRTLKAPVEGTSLGF